MRVPDDVPIQRPSVGAMGWMGRRDPDNEARFKPYVYRGWGIDLIENPPRVEYIEPEPPQSKAARERQRLVREHLARLDAETIRWSNGARWDGIPVVSRWPRWGIYPEQPKPAKQKKKKKPKRDGVIRAAPGWQPSTGADAEAWLLELGED